MSTCPLCESSQPRGQPFCATCGWALAAPAAAVAVSAVPLSQGQVGLPSVRPGQPPRVAGPPSGMPGPAQDLLNRWRTTWSPALLAFLRRSTAERTGLQAAAVIIAVCLVVNLVGWVPLSKPPQWINRVAQLVTPTSCSWMSRDPFFGICASFFGIITMFGSLVAMGLMFFFRKGLGKAIQGLLRRLPAEYGFLAAPVLATIMFTMGWAGNAFHFFDRPGIVRDGLFPWVVGLLTFATVRWGPSVMRALAAVMNRRDQLHIKVRLGLTMAVSWVLSIALTSVYPVPVRDQVMVVLGTIIGYLLMAPRKGDLPTALQEALAGAPGAGVSRPKQKGGAGA